MDKLKTKLQFKVTIPVVGLLIALAVLVTCAERHIEFGKLRNQHLSDLHKTEQLMVERLDSFSVDFAGHGPEINRMLGDLKKAMGFDFVVAIDKSHFNRTDFQRGFDLPNHGGYWNSPKEGVVVNHTFKSFPAHLTGCIQNCDAEKRCHEVRLITIGDKKQMAGCFGLTDAAGTRIGRVYVIQDVTTLTGVIARSSIFFGAMIIAAGFCASIFFYFYIRHIDHRLIETDRKQKIELLHRQFAEAQLTEAKNRAEAANAELKRAQKKVQLHVNQTPLGVIQWDPDLRVESWNPAAEQIFGFTAAEAIGKLANDLIVPKDAQSRIEKIRQGLIAQTGGTEECNQNVTRNGRRITCRWHNTALVDSAGEVIGVSSIVQDVTKEFEYEQRLQEAKERAEAANRAKSQFMANMSHELRTPMNAIMGFSDLLRDEDLTDEQIDYIETIYASSHHLLRLINDVLDISKIEAGKEEIAWGVCSLRDQLHQLEHLMQNEAHRKGLRFELDIRADVPEQIITDAKHLYQCLINLTGNAIKFTQTGSVSLHVGLLDGASATSLYFEVVDTGIGIPPDRQTKIFDSFEQADVSTSRKYGGTGLGLTITRQLIKMMGGKVMLESVEGVGSTFTITLPLKRTTGPVKSSS